jgi:hypothetical protein
VAFLFVNLGGNTQNIHAVALRVPAPRRRAQDLRRATPLEGTPPFIRGQGLVTRALVSGGAALSLQGQTQQSVPRREQVQAVRNITRLGILATSLVTPLLLGVAAATPASADYSDYCSDQKTVPGTGNFETNQLGLSVAGFSASYGAQGFSDASKGYPNVFQDNCVKVTTPAFNLPLVGQFGGKLVGEYLSNRIQPTRTNCPVEIYFLSDGNAFLNHGPYHNCNP